eukprot:447914-Pyramimonas_sp.AAC.1
MARGSSEDLGLLVGGTDTFAQQRANASAVVVDATALWLKLRGEEEACIHDGEIYAASAKKRIQNLRRKYRET